MSTLDVRNAELHNLIDPDAPGEDGSVLFLTARTSVYRLQTKTRGALPGPANT